MIEAADRIFHARGFHEASMDEIAAACGVTKPMLYAYFGSKEGLFASCGAVARNTFRARVRDAAGEVAVDPDERLWRSLRAAFERVAENREVWRLLYPPEGPPPSGPLGARAALNRAAMTELVTTLLREAAAAPGSAADDAAYEHIEPLAHALVGAVLGMASWAVAHPDEPSDLHALRLMNLVWRGFEGLREGNLWMPAEWRQQ